MDAGQLRASRSPEHEIARRGMALRPLTVVLSSYNGAKFLPEQIESIRRQTCTDWSLLIRDDGSADGTRQLLQSLAQADSRITIVSDGLGNLGPAASFGTLLEHAYSRGAQYVALADQDDVWLPEKLDRQLELLRSKEAAAGARAPLLVHSDLAVVAPDLQSVHPSFLSFEHLSHIAEWPIGTLLVQNFVTGCSTLVNRALLGIALPVPTAAIMHDWWLALCAACYGGIWYLPEATVLYRQHGGNTLGSKGWLPAFLASLRSPVTWWTVAGHQLDSALRQAQSLHERLEQDPGGIPDVQKAVREWCRALASGSALDRVRTAHRYRIRPLTLLPFPVRFYLRLALRARRASADR
jgi:rhamnosyltransferase